MGTKKAKVKSAHPWRDNIEAITISIVIIVLFKYFILEAYKIPTGSMQPTLMGWDQGDGTGVFDRVLVDKLSYHLRDPDRFEVAVFKYPLNESKNYIKRIVGMPGDEMRIQAGDAVVRQPDGGWAIPERSDSVLESMLKKLRSKGQWHIPSKGWTIENHDLIATTEGQASFPRTQSSVKDRYGDGYPGKLGPLVERPKRHVGTHDVGDLRIEFEVCPADDCREIEVELREGPRRYRFTIPGPAADAEAFAALNIHMRTNDPADEAHLSEESIRIDSGDCVTIQVQNIDDRVRLLIDGDSVILADVLPINQLKLKNSGVNLRTTGGGAKFLDIQIWRDVYYTANQTYTQWIIPDGHYVMLGDNTQNSSDSRDWSFRSYDITSPDGSVTTVRGNRRDNNPRSDPGAPGGKLLFFNDQLGETHVFHEADSKPLPMAQASYVPRDLIRGRAVIVVWPMVPSLDVYRLRWVR